MGFNAVLQREADAYSAASLVDNEVFSAMESYGNADYISALELFRSWLDANKTEVSTEVCAAFLDSACRIHEQEHNAQVDNSWLKLTVGPYLERLNAADPSPAKIDHLSRYYEYTGDLERSVGCLEELTLLYPADKHTKLSMLRYSAIKRTLKEQDISVSLMHKAVADPVVYDEEEFMLILGFVYEYFGESSLAVEAYLHAYKALQQSGKLITTMEERPKIRGLPGLDKNVHEPFENWLHSKLTWIQASKRFEENRDFNNAAEMLHKAINTPSGMKDDALWLQLGCLHHLLGRQQEAIQAIQQAYALSPQSLYLRDLLATWDPKEWGAHNKLEDTNATKIQSTIRQRHAKKIAQAKARLREEQNNAAMQLQRIVRGYKGRRLAEEQYVLAQRRWAEYQEQLAQYNAAVLIQRVYRAHIATLRVSEIRRRYNAARVLQCFHRKTQASAKLSFLRDKHKAEIEAFGATEVQRLYRAYAARQASKNELHRRHQATLVQAWIRAKLAQKRYRQLQLEKYAAVRIQTVYRGAVARSAYLKIRSTAAAKIQAMCRARAIRQAFPTFREARFELNNQKINRGIKRNAKSHDTSRYEDAEPYNSKSEHMSLQAFQSTVARTAEEAAEILSVICVAGTARRLAIRNWSVNTKCALALAEIVKRGEVLRTVHLHNIQGFTSSHMTLVADALRCHNFRITTLEVEDLSKGVAMPLLRTCADYFFARYSHLTHLSLSQAHVNDQGALSLAQGLAMNRNLQRIILSGNSITDTGAVAIAQSLHSKSAIHHMNLAANHIASQGAEAFAKALSRPSVRIGHLDFSHNSITLRGALALLAACRREAKLWIGIYGNPVEDGIIARFPQLLKKKKGGLHETFEGDSKAMASPAGLAGESCSLREASALPVAGFR